MHLLLTVVLSLFFFVFVFYVASSTRLVAKILMNPRRRVGQGACCECWAAVLDTHPATTELGLGLAPSHSTLDAISGVKTMEYFASHRRSISKR